MTLVDVLRAAEEDVLGEAEVALGRAHLRHYDAAGIEESRSRLAHLFGLAVDCLADETLVPMSACGARVAAERFRAGFSIGEVQTAFNVLEEAIWHVVVPRLELEELADAMGKIGTVLGVGRNALAQTWVSLASGEHVPSLDLTALFQGVSS